MQYVGPKVTLFSHVTSQVTLFPSGRSGGFVNLWCEEFGWVNSSFVVDSIHWGRRKCNRQAIHKLSEWSVIATGHRLYL